MHNYKYRPHSFLIAVIVALSFCLLPVRAGYGEDNHEANLASPEVGGEQSAASAATLAKEDAAPAATADEPAQAVKPKPKSVSMDARRLLFGKKKASLKIKLTIKPKNADISDLEFTSANKKVAKVDPKTGKVTAVGYGSTVITVKVGKKTASCPVTVAKKWVALTFDDGPGKPTEGLLKELRKRDVDVTFFIIGRQAQSKNSRKLLKKMVADGHEIANHTWDHVGTASRVISQVRRTDKVIKDVTGRRASLMRPPYGSVNGNTMKCGKPVILWSVDPQDWRYRNADTVYNHVISHASSGSIILLHDIHPTSTKAGIRIIDTLEKKGYAFVTVSQLLKNPKPGKLYRKGPTEVRTMKILY